MFEAVKANFANSAITVMAAAVADYSPTHQATEKIKKTTDNLQIALSKTIDILQYVGEQKKADQLTIGFALETTNELVNAQNKLKSKNADLIILNSLNDEGAGFNVDSNKITMIDKNGQIEAFELKSKNKVAQDILQKITQL
jgi:phosphopantothenoylcysteine decarboxylase/phosphopantothenate--cysteine ligase